MPKGQKGVTNLVTPEEGDNKKGGLSAKTIYDLQNNQHAGSSKAVICTNYGTGLRTRDNINIKNLDQNSGNYRNTLYRYPAAMSQFDFKTHKSSGSDMRTCISFAWV